MSQIELEILKQGGETPRVISASFFTMKDAYRLFDKYTSHLKSFCRVTNILGFCTRIYTDDTGKDIALEVASKYPHVSVIHYNCPQFREGDGHVGTFGTMVRFLPLFEKLELVWVSDIDIPADWLNPRRIKIMDNVGAQVSFMTMLCYQNKPYGRHHTVLAGTIISRIQFPKQMLTKFLNKVLEGGFHDTIEELNETNKIRKKAPSTFPYGTDEIFTNTSFYDSLIRHNIKCVISKYYERAGVYLAFNGLLTPKEDQLFTKYYHTLKLEYIPKIKHILTTRIPQLVPKYPCLQEVLDILPTLGNSMSKTFVVQGKELN